MAKSSEKVSILSGIGSQITSLLEAAGIPSVKTLARQKASVLIQKLAEVNTKRKFVRRLPSLAQVEGWIDQAKQRGKRIPRSIDLGDLTVSGRANEYSAGVRIPRSNGNVVDAFQGITKIETAGGFVDNSETLGPTDELPGEPGKTNIPRQSGQPGEPGNKNIPRM